MKRVLIFCLILILSAACGKKDDPHPIASLNIPQPTWAAISVTEDGVHVTNNSDEYPILVERAESEVGDLFFPLYQTIATVKPHSSFVDTGTQNNVRYIYRIRTINDKYGAYSAPVTQVVSYKGVVAVESVHWRIEKETLCLDIKVTKDVANYRIIINGKETDVNRKCHPFPKVPQILLVVVPYSETGLPGGAYSESINTEAEGILLPPQNIKVLRREKQITLSWDTVSGAERYEISAASGKRKTGPESATSTIYNSNLVVAGRCTAFTLISIGTDRRSDPVQVQSCP